MERPDERVAVERELETYRRSLGYLSERWRPRFHLSPERNWMSDPNGLVSFAGEHHAFYQHNPFGVGWGEMSWGHAVSRDLVHWEHLPVALWREGDEAIYSGCVVVDERNTSGFGSADRPPLVAVYTSHRPWLETQALAYSTDAGRTWTKYAGNPVLDLGESDFRDPKVFWHEPVGRWVMVVSLAMERRLQFYHSRNLRDWDLVGGFGPVGDHEPKVRWECPELLELPVFNAQGQPTGATRWLLKTDVGDNAYAGGSGGDYFVGSFDGRSFTCDDPALPFQPIDYGRDFYAAQSWSGYATDDGLPVWAAWLGNWESVETPTSPWRGEFSAPRELLLRETPGGLRLAQRPIAALEAQRRDHQAVVNAPLSAGDDAFATFTPPGQAIDAELEVQLGSAERVELGVLAGDGEVTRVSYDRFAEELVLDRTGAGDPDHHPAHWGVHRAPLPLADGVLRLRVLVDVSVVEVFGADGTVVITDRVFPSETSGGVTLHATGGEATIHRADVWRMASIWP